MEVFVRGKLGDISVFEVDRGVEDNILAVSDLAVSNGWKNLEDDEIVE